MLDVEEYRQPPETTGLKRGRRRGSTRYDRIPIALCDELHFDKLSDWFYFVPNGLESEYTSRDFAEKALVHTSTAQLVLNILTALGVTERIGKQGRSYLYRTVIHTDEEIFPPHASDGQ